MKHLLARGNLDLLARYAYADVLLAFDFDGTLAPIVRDHRDAAMRATTRALLTAVAQRYSVAVISGRGKADVASRVARTHVKYVVGNHGIEPGSDIARFEREVAHARPLVARALATVPGVEIEDKRYSLAVHYRGAPRKLEARIAIARAIAALPRPMRVIPGKLVANVVPRGARNKGDVVLALRARERAAIALYVGDDVTDEDVFAIDQPGRLVSARIGRARRSAAPYFLRDQREIDTLLARLIALREPVTSPPARRARGAASAARTRR